MPKLCCKRVLFYSYADEWAFFQFALHIPTVKKLAGEDDLMFIHVGTKPSEEDLRDLIGLFERYRLSDMSQLARFHTPENAHWFADPKAFWHEKVFGEANVAQGTRARSTG